MLRPAACFRYSFVSELAEIRSARVIRAGPRNVFAKETTALPANGRHLIFHLLRRFRPFFFSPFVRRPRFAGELLVP